MARTNNDAVSQAWPAMMGTALRVVFGLIWVVDAALTWTPGFAAHYVGYLHNASQGQPDWSAWWFAMWIAVVTPHAGLFIWLTRIAESLLALALLLGFARKSLYVAGALFSLLIWSTAEGFGGPFTAGATNMGAAIGYVLLFIALIAINYHGGTSPYSIDYLIEKRWPRWRHIAEWSAPSRTPVARPVSWRVQVPALLGIAVLVFFIIGGLHSTLNVRAPSPAAAAAAVSPLSLASSKPISAVRDARLPPLTPGSEVTVNVVVSDDTVAIASGVQYKAWTFNGTVPAPTIHVRQGQTVNVVLTNHGTMPHSIDFHAAITPPSLHYVDILPGKTLKFSFVANTPGAFLYHCGTAPALLHIGNGMFGALIVDPKTPLPPAAESYVIVQSEWYTRQVSGTLMAGDYQKMLAERPDEVVFNGAAFQYRDHPLPVTAGKRVRVYFVNAGPNLWSSFHVIGGIFDKVYPDGNPADALSGVSTYTVGPGAGAIFDLMLDQPGEYPFVDHSMAHAVIGAIGIFKVYKPGTVPPPPAPVAKAPAAPALAAAAPAASTTTSKPTGPYTFDPVKGGALFSANCAACHQASGLGIPGVFPPLKGNAAVLDPNPAKQIMVVLHGLHGENVGGTVYPGAMPPFAESLSDLQIADIINHERSAWGNQSRQVTPDEVKALRARGATK